MSYPDLPNENPTGGAVLSGALLLLGVLGMMCMGILDIWF
jgi:hypothetical protein